MTALGQLITVSKEMDNITFGQMADMTSITVPRWMQLTRDPVARAPRRDFIRKIAVGALTPVADVHAAIAADLGVTTDGLDAALTIDDTSPGTWHPSPEQIAAIASARSIEPSEARELVASVLADTATPGYAASDMPAIVTDHGKTVNITKALISASVDDGTTRHDIDIEIEHGGKDLFIDGDANCVDQDLIGAELLPCLHAALSRVVGLAVGTAEFQRRNGLTSEEIDEIQEEDLG